MNEQSSSSVFTNDNIEKAVPSEWKYKVINKVVFGSPSKLEVCIKVSLYTIAEIEKWIEALEEKTQCSYSIQMTKKTVGEKVLFKRRYHCRVKTNLNKCYPDLKSGFKNAKKCPSKLSITLMHIKKKKYRGKYPPDPEMPCIVDYVITHNHSLSIAAKFRKVTRNVQETMNRLFRAGHSASTVYEILRIDAQINNPNTYEELLVNRSVCPDRNYCHKWFNEYKKEHGTIDVKDKTFVSKRLQEFNIEVNEECGKIEILDDGFVIVLCPPLFKRVHQYIKSPSEVVFVAAINPADNDGSKAFFLMTHSECGALPLGIIITSSENSELITSGLNTLKVLVGDTMFFGRKEGPQLFLVDDCEAVQMAINTVWPETNILFCSLHILHSLWKYLLCSKNGINKDEPINFFKQFRMIMYADTVDECNQCYSEAMLSAANHPNYLQILEAYWDKRDMWTMSYRNCLLPSDNLKINSLEKMMCLLREPMFHRMRSFNVIQLVDFLLTKFVDFYTLRLLDAANNRLIRDMSRKIPLPPDVKDLEQVNSYLYLVPSIKLPYIRYYVNIEIVACTCLKYTTGYICNHIGWLLTMFLSYQDQIEDHNVREIFQKTATGERFLPEQPYEVFQETEELDPKMKYAEPESKVVEQLIIAGNEVIKLQIVNDEVDPNVSMPMQISNLPYVSGVLVPVVTDEQALEAGENVNQELFGTFSGFLKKSPLLVGPVLQRMLNKTKSLNSVEDFLVACQKFNEDGTPS